MAESRGKTDRAEKRIQVVPTEVRGIITHGTDQQPFLIWDLSKKGIGIWVSDKIKESEPVVLTIGQPYLIIVKCKVKWSEALGDNKGYRIGLKCVDTEKTFETLCAAFTSLKAESGPKIK